MVSNVLRLLGVAITSAAALLIAPVPFATAQGCPDVEVVFARGTGEPPGVGGVGQAFVDAVRTQAGPRSVNVYPVNYAASGDFMDRIAFARTVVDGIRDAGLHIETTAANCPDTRIVLGGFSQGAALAGYVDLGRNTGAGARRIPRVHPQPDALGGGRPRRRRWFSSVCRRLSS